MNIWLPKKIDLYIMKRFLGTFFFALVLIITISVAIDVSERMEYFIEGNVPFKEVVTDYYLNFIPYFAAMFSSLFIFIAVIFITSKMAYDTEIIAIISSGVSFLRLMVPYFLGALILAIFSFGLNDWILPNTNVKKLAFEDKYFHDNKAQRFTQTNVHLQIAPGVFAYMETYSMSSQVAQKFTLEEFDGINLKSKLVADEARYDSLSARWKLRNWYIRSIDGEIEKVTRGTTADTALILSPNDFSGEEHVTDMMSLVELRKEIKILRMRGSDNIRTFLMAFHQRIASPFSAFILTLMGVSLSSKKVRGGKGIHIAIGITLSFVYILLMKFSTQFAVRGSFDPMLAAWLPNIIFTVIAVFLYRIAPK